MATTGDSIGPWTLGERLGVGGNATVWRASRDGGEDVALKLSNTTKTQHERYRRFVQEIEFLRELGDFPGVLPLLDAHLPQRPRSAGRRRGRLPGPHRQRPPGPWPEPAQPSPSASCGGTPPQHRCRAAPQRPRRHPGPAPAGHHKPVKPTSPHLPRPCPSPPTTRPLRPLRRGTTPVAAGRQSSLGVGVDPDGCRSCRW
jgi:hypothetical protein